MLKFVEVSKSFGNIKALEDISFDVDSGEFVFITGPSGAGKTTVLKLILRDLLPEKGEIYIEDNDITKLSEKKVPFLRQQLGTVFQDFKILPERTVNENVEVALAVSGVDQKEWPERVAAVLDLVGLTERADLFPKQLSGGELQRVSVARALVTNPKMLLADEPTGNLDWDTADALMDIFEKVNKEGMTVIMATHHKGIVNKLKKRQIKLDKGKLVGGGGKKKKKSKKDAKKEEKKEEKKDDEKRVKVKVEEVEK